MARTKQTARKSCGGKAPRKMMSAGSSTQLRQFLTGRQTATFAGSGRGSGAEPKQKTSYINYENMFYSYGFHTGPSSSRSFEPRFTFGTGRSQISGETEHWVGMSFNSKYDGEGMKVHGRPHLNLAVVLDISGSMSIPFDQSGPRVFGSAGTGPDKLTVAKKCLQALTEQLKPGDQFGLVRFNHDAEVHCPMTHWGKVNKKKLKSEIDGLRAYGSTNLSAAITCATDLFRSAGETANASSRVIFLTDLCSTVDSANDEKRLLDTIRTNAKRGIYTTVVGIGMDLNVKLVEEISSTPGAKYCSVDGAEEFGRIMNKEFDYDVTILAFNIRVELLTPGCRFIKGYGSPELNDLKPGKPVVISSEFPSWQDEKGESKGGLFLFKFGSEAKGKGKGKGRSGGLSVAPKELKIKVTWEDLSGVEHSEVKAVKTRSDGFGDTGTRKAALLVHYVDLHNDYVHERKKSGTKFLELFQTFRDHFLKELEDMKDKSIATANRGDLELLDKIIQLETPGSGAVVIPSAPSSSFPPPSSIYGPVFGGASPFSGTVSFGSVTAGVQKQRSSSRSKAPKRLQAAKGPVKVKVQVPSKRKPRSGGVKQVTFAAATASSGSTESSQPRKRKAVLRADKDVTPSTKKPHGGTSPAAKAPSSRGKNKGGATTGPGRKQTQPRRVARAAAGPGTAARRSARLAKQT